MTLSLLRAFVVVADTEHLGRAAARLHVSASPLSRQIRALEEEIGLALFARERRRLRLTETGRWFVGEARALLDQAERLARAAADRRYGSAGAVTVGFVSAAMWSDILPRALETFQRAHPDVRIALQALSSSTQLEAMRRGALDLALVHAAPPDDELRVAKVLEERFRLAMPRAHPLARRRVIRQADLGGLRWIALRREAAPVLYDQFRARMTELGLRFDVVCEASNPATIVRLIECRLGVALLPEGAARLAPRAVVFREIPWLTRTVSLYAVSRAHGQSPLVDRLATAVAEANTRPIIPIAR